MSVDVPTARSDSDERQDVLASDEAFQVWYTGALPRIYGYVLARCGHDTELAEELTQQAFTEAVRGRRALQSATDPTAWMFGIARHRLADHFRRVGRERRGMRDLTVREIVLDDPAREWHRLDQLQAIRSAMDALSPIYRTVLLLKFVDGLTIREVARVVARTESATESLLGRARVAFERAYRERNDE
jgi:RNA polymerase sigma-70 factor (ECF subfamily)